MKISIITLFPGMMSGFFEESIIKKAQQKGLVEIELINLRDFATDSYGTVDDRPYGGGAGMVLKVEPLVAALEQIKHKEPVSKTKVVITSARGQKYRQEKAREYAQLDHLIIIAGHYEGYDERIMDYVDAEVSLGDFIMTGGEITASAIVDSVVRLLPGVLKKEDATQNESFFEVTLDELVTTCGEDETLQQLKTAGKQVVQLLEYPHYTRPAEFQGKTVPPILLQGNHKEIEKWRLQQACALTKKRRMDLLTTV